MDQAKKLSSNFYFLKLSIFKFLKALQERLLGYAQLLEDLSREREEIMPETSSNEIDESLQTISNLNLEISRTTIRLESFFQQWKSYTKIMNSLKNVINKKSEWTETDLEELKSSFETGSQHFSNAISTIKLKDESDQKARFEKRLKQFQSFIEKRQTSTKKERRKRGETLETIEEDANEVENPEEDTLFSTNNEIKSEIQKCENQLETLNQLQVVMKSVETKRTQEDLEKYSIVRRNILSKINRHRCILEKLKMSQDILTELEEKMEKLDSETSELKLKKEIVNRMEDQVSQMSTEVRNNIVT
jgi:hypothetical protein